MATSDQDITHGGAAEAGVLVREGSYGTQVMTVEPGGAEFIPLNERHGRPIQLFWTWTSPNMEFATIFVGVLAVAGFGMGFWSAALALDPRQRDRRHHPGHLVPARPEVRGAADGAEPARVRLLGQRAARRAELGDRRDRLVRGEQRQRRPRAERADPLAEGALPAHHRGGAGRRGVLRLQPGAPVRAVRLPHPRRHLPDRVRGHPEQGPSRRSPPAPSPARSC